MAPDWRTKLQDLPSLKEVLETHGLIAKKSLGQNFLTDLNVTRKIARFAGPFKSNPVYEIGPGPGGLTRALFLEGAEQVMAFEKDERALEVLAPLKEAVEGRLDIQLTDALTVDYAHALRAPAILVGNLPYNIATELLFLWLEVPHLFERLVLMFQKEVAERLTAVPGTKAYGRLSVLTQERFEAHMVYKLPPHLFLPAPKVISGLVRLVPKSTVLTLPEWEALKLVTRHAFGQRRKMLKSTLKPLGPSFLQRLETLGADLTLRAEDVAGGTYRLWAQAYVAQGVS